MKRPVVITLLIIALVLVCAGIGSVVYFSNGFQTNNPFDRNNISSVLEESKTIKVDAEKPISLKVNNAAGNITVTGSDVETIQVKAIKTAYDSTQARADEEVKGVKYTVEQNGNAVTLKYELPKSVNFNNKVNTIDFIITVPNETAVNVDTSFGEVNVFGTKGNVIIANDFGDVAAQNIEGALSVDSNSGKINATSIKASNEEINLHTDFGSVSLEKINAKNITAQSNSGTIQLNDVRATGDIFTKSDFGDIKYENGSGASLDVESNSGKVSLTKLNITKELKINNDFGELELEQAIAGSYNLHTNSGSITVDGAKGTLKAYTDFGGISIQNADSVTLDVKTSSGTVDFSGSLGEGPHTVKSDFGEINLSLPADSKLNADLTTDFGGISSDIPLTITLTGKSDKEHQAGTMNGGGDQLTVKTNSGDINIKAIK